MTQESSPPAEVAYSLPPFQLVTFQTESKGERRRYRVAVGGHAVLVSELMPAHIAGFHPEMLDDPERWSHPFLDPTPVIAILIAAFCHVRAGLTLHRIDGMVVAVDLGTVRLDAVKAFVAGGSTC